MSLSSFVRPAKEKVPVSATPLAPSVGGPDRPSLDSLQSKADGSAQVSGLRKLSDAAPQAAPAQAQDSDQAAVQEEASGSGVEPVKSRVEDAGASAFHEKTVSAVAGLASSANQGEGFYAVSITETASVSVDMKSLDFVTTGLQHATQTLYSVRDLYEKRDWKSAGAMLLDVVNAFLAIEDKVKVIGLADAIPFIGGAITGFRQMINVSRVNESMATLEKVMSKISLDADDQKVLKAFTKEQKIGQFKHATQSILGFARIVAEFFGVGTIVGIASGLVSLVSTIRDQWVNYRERVVTKAQDRLGLAGGLEEEDKSGIEELNDVMNLEGGIRVTVALGDGMEEELTGKNFSIIKLVESYNALQANVRQLDSTPEDDPAYEELAARVDEMERGMMTGVYEYNEEMTQLTAKFFGGVFKPITLDQVERLHDYHVTCMHRVLQQGKERQQKIEASYSIFRPFMKTEDKQKFLQEIYKGAVPDKVDIKLGEVSAEANDYFWGKTREALNNALLPAQMSKATLVREMRQIMLRNKGEILEKMSGNGSTFQSADAFEQDMNRVLNTLNL
jgi:hypothetical protein